MSLVNNKKSFQKMISCVLAGLMTVGSLTGCGNGQSGKSSYVAPLPTQAEESEVYVAPIENLSDEFIKGMDISSILAEEKSGVVYYDENGVEKDLFEILAESGVNYIRVRVWNNPFDENGNGYGGGNCDAETAAEIGKRAAAYNMKLLVDFHYSDFWADPKKQMSPKAWENMSIEEKSKAIYDYTKKSLTQIIKAGAQVGMVQIGNEINNGMSGETSDDNVMALLLQASKAVRDVAASKKQDIKIAVHYTEVDNRGGMLKKAQWLSNGGLDYDIFGISYYPFWHGTLDNMKSTLGIIKATYGKEVAVLETSYPYTGEDGDASGNSVNADDLRLQEYKASLQGQTSSVRDIMAAVSEIGGLGVFYWEGAWIPVGGDYTTNSVIWRDNGSGWASEYAADYDPNDAGKYYGGSSWDNQAFFDFSGHRLASLDVFKYAKYGTICEPQVQYYKNSEVTVSIGDAIKLPEGVDAVYNNPALNTALPVVWDEASIASIDSSVAGEYKVTGSLEDGTQVECQVTVAFINWLANPSFDEDVASMWIVEGETKSATDIQKKAADAVTGENAFHWWRTGDQQFSVSQTVSGLEAGSYNAYAYIQGGDVGDNAEIYLYIQVGDKVYTSEPVALTGWCEWKMPQVKGVELAEGEDITVGMYVKCASGGWGTIDDFCLYKE